jgi:hypothetical protein
LKGLQYRIVINILIGFCAWWQENVRISIRHVDIARSIACGSLSSLQRFHISNNNWNIKNFISHGWIAFLLLYYNWHIEG